jgi:hypothetical protein
VDALDFSNYPGLSLVDTTGAGDTFTSAFAVMLSEIIMIRGVGSATDAELF